MGYSGYSLMQFDFQRVAASVFASSLSLLLAAGTWGLLTHLSYEQTAVTVSNQSVSAQDEQEVLGYSTTVNTAPEVFTVIAEVPQLTKNRTLALFGSRQSYTSIRIKVNGTAQADAGNFTEGTTWEAGISLAEGRNVVYLEAVDGQGLKLASKEVVVELDTKRPSCSLNYPPQPAGVGVYRISLSCSEAINPQPKIYINQPGSVDVYAALMNGSGANWFFDYYVRQANGQEYLDGTAQVEVVTNSDFAGNPLEPITNTTFQIKTGNTSTAPTVTATPKPDATRPVVLLPETGEDDAQTNTENNEQNSTVLPKVTINSLSYLNREASYRNGSVLQLVVEYSGDQNFGLDAKLEEYSYIGKSIQTINNGVVADFSSIDSNFADRPVRVSARRAIGDDRYARVIRYHISSDSTLQLPLSASIRLSYRLNGEVVAQAVPLSVRIVPDSQAVMRVEKMNEVDIDTSEPIEMSTEVLANEGYTLRGTGIPSARVSILIYSDPVTAEAVTDDQGNWEYTITQELTPGDHTVYAALIDSNGVPQDYVEVLSFTVVSPVVALEVAADDGSVTEAGDVSVADVSDTVTESSPLRVIVYILIAAAVVSGLLLIAFRMRSAPHDRIFTQ
ncbi:MAG: hypothetical protein TR69_WS6001000252 [candidate division WS6 bacterium OLB20]|uniref:Bacterial Ig-like domain-containing protein n=1 Tax=candidate division WS6 bacterium OLB20 TaxID=1617426 RepID=A0A136M0H8_9BACT|nr:MAG: hypothetical protein TR69_WS6001000252 [candidate division WS6 bacterium OLB20]